MVKRMRSDRWIVRVCTTNGMYLEAEYTKDGERLARRSFGELRPSRDAGLLYVELRKCEPGMSKYDSFLIDEKSAA